MNTTFSKSCNKEVSKPVVKDTLVVAPVEPVVIPAPVKESFNVKLPNGIELNAYRGGIEDKLVNF